MFPNSSNLCYKCKKHKSMFLFWSGDCIQTFWKETNSVIQKVTVKRFTASSSFYLFNHTSSQILEKVAYYHNHKLDKFLTLWKPCAFFPIVFFLSYYLILYNAASVVGLGGIYVVLDVVCVSEIEKSKKSNHKWQTQTKQNEAWTRGKMTLKEIPSVWFQFSQFALKSFLLCMIVLSRHRWSSSQSKSNWIIQHICFDIARMRAGGQEWSLRVNCIRQLFKHTKFPPNKPGLYTSTLMQAKSYHAKYER